MNRAAGLAFVIALGFWMGGLGVLSFVLAPIAFREAPSREVAGRIVGGSLRTFGKVELACAAAALLAAAARRRERFGRVRLAGVGAMAVLAASYVFWVYPQAAAARGVSESAFAFLHRLSVVLVGCNLVLGVALMGLEPACARKSDGA